MQLKLLLPIALIGAGIAWKPYRWPLLIAGAAAGAYAMGLFDSVLSSGPAAVPPSVGPSVQKRAGIGAF